MANDFLVFDETKSNLMNPVDYSLDGQRISGVTPGMAVPALHNRFYYQVSLMVSQLGQFMSDSGVDALDTSAAGLLTAIKAVFSSSAAVGDFKFNAVGAPGPRWLNADGNTIGSPSSGATALASNDTLALYTALWNTWANAQLPIQTSGGVTTTRGGSAAADFAANKRLPLPDGRGRQLIGLDPTATVVSFANVLGATGGEEKHTMTIPELVTHHHVINTTGSISSGSIISPQVSVYSAGGGQTQDTGSSTPFNVEDPSLVSYLYVKY